MLSHSESSLARVTQQLSKLEKRDWELWANYLHHGCAGKRRTARHLI